MYIGAIPTPAATESRQEFTATANQTVFNTTGGTVGYCDCFLNGVKMANSDFSFDGADVTLTSGAAAGDVLAVVMRQADNALVALPIKDSAGNDVLSEASGVVNFPTGHIVQVQYANFHGIKEIAAPVNSWTDIPELAIEFTCKTANPKIFLQGQVLWSSGRYSTWMGAHIKYIKKVGTANWADVQVNSGSHGGQVAANQGGLLDVSDSHYNEPFTYTWVDTLTCSAGTTLKFRPQVLGNGYTSYAKIRINYAVTASSNYTAGGTSNLTVMEIQS